MGLNIQRQREGKSRMLSPVLLSPRSSRLLPLPASRQWVSLGLLLLLLALPLSARASVALLMEEPYGEFGPFNPTGHAAVYLNHICAQSPTELRPCRPGEFGAVISRYHKIDG